MIWSGCAACPDEDTTYGVFSSPELEDPVDEGGKDEGRLL